MTPIQQLIQELTIDVQKVNSVIKMCALNDHQKKLAMKQKETLTDIIYSLETNYLNIETAFILKLKK